MDDNNGNPTAKILSWCILLLDILVLHIRIVFTSVLSFVQLFIPPEEKSVAGERVLITGTGHGIGKELARQYGELGAKVICVDINEKLNQSTVDELKKSGIEARAYTCDVSQRDQVLDLGKKVTADVGDITILVNNAGIMPCKPLEEHSASEIVKLFDINVLAHFWMFEAFLPRMMEKNYGHVVGLSSMAGIMGLANLAPYCATKFAVRGLMEATAEEFRLQGRGINFTTIYPYMVNTGLVKSPPKIRFPSAFPMQDAKQVAAEIISAQRRGYRERSIPFYMKRVNDIGRLLPVKTALLMMDFVDIGLNPHE